MTDIRAEMIAYVQRTKPCVFVPVIRDLVDFSTYEPDHPQRLRYTHRATLVYDWYPTSPKYPQKKRERYVIVARTLEGEYQEWRP